MGMEITAANLVPALGAHLVVAGHSLGAARALIFAALLAAALSPQPARPPDAVVVFGSPRPGFELLADLLAPVPIRAYRNDDAHGHDLMTDVPVHIPDLAPYVHPRQPLIDVTAAPPARRRLGPVRLAPHGALCAGLAASARGIH